LYVFGKSGNSVTATLAFIALFISKYNNCFLSLLWQSLFISYIINKVVDFRMCYLLLAPILPECVQYLIFYIFSNLNSNSNLEATAFRCTRFDLPDIFKVMYIQ
jgi:hypothetical protein